MPVFTSPKAALTPVTVVTLILLIAGPALLALAAARAGLELVAAGIVVSGLGLSLAALKVFNASARQAGHLSRQRQQLNRLRAEVKRGAGSAGESGSKQASGGGGVGRSAAAGDPDQARGQKLLAALRLAHSASDQSAKLANLPKVAVIATPALIEHVKPQFAAQLLSPSTAGAQLVAGQFEALIIEEAALERGVWFGALTSAGTPLFDELLSLLSLAKDQQLMVQLVSGDRRSPQAVTLRRIANAHTGDAAEQSAGAPAPIAALLADYADRGSDD